jgi:signal transduction histidine kinase
MAIGQAAAGTPRGGGIRRVLTAPLQPRTWTATIYLLGAMFVGLTWHVVLAVGLTLGVGLLIIWVGVFVLALTVLAWRGGAWLERRWVRLMLGVQIPEPYRPLPAGSLWQRARALAGDPATWKDLAYLVLLGPLGLVWFVVTTTLWGMGILMLLGPLWYWLLPHGEAVLFTNGDRGYLAMDLGMARAKLETDPAAATALVGEAHEEAKRALAELRDLARGIHPAVLADRGLDAAISALAARSPVPVGVDVATGRLPDPVESAAYFVVAEALTNAAKHARAAEISVRISRHRDLLIVEVIDDGAGGADPARGSGLRGLADRVAAVDGQLTVTSPLGGPTVIRAELPCGS